MARYTGPSTKVARKFGEPIFGPDKNFEHKNFPPGQHGLARERNSLSMVFSLKRSRRLNAPTAFLRSSSVTSTRRLPR